MHSCRMYQKLCEIAEITRFTSQKHRLKFQDRTGSTDCKRIRILKARIPDYSSSCDQKMDDFRTNGLEIRETTIIHDLVCRNSANDAVCMNGRVKVAT